MIGNVYTIRRVKENYIVITVAMNCHYAQYLGCVTPFPVKLGIQLEEKN